MIPRAIASAMTPAPTIASSDAINRYRSTGPPIASCTERGAVTIRFPFHIDMVAAPGKLPVGTALFFNKAGSTYKLAGVIVLN